MMRERRHSGARRTPAFFSLPLPLPLPLPLLLLLFAAASILPLVGCDPTEVVVVVDTDEPLSSELDVINFQIGGPDFAPSFTATAPASRLPATLGVTTQGHDQAFNVFVTLNQGLSNVPVLTRNALDVPFSTNEELVLFLPLLKACACEGTNCANATDPNCLDLNRRQSCRPSTTATFLACRRPHRRPFAVGRQRRAHRA